MNIELATTIGSAIVAAIAIAFAAGMYHANKRPINIHQEQHNHAAPVTVESGGGGSISPKLIGGLAIMLVIGVAAALVIQAVMTFVTAAGNELSRIGHEIDRTFNPPAMPTAIPQAPSAPALPDTAPAVARPSTVERPIEIVPDHQFQLSDLLMPALAVLAVMAISVWGGVVYLLINRHKQRPTAQKVSAPTARPHVSAREVFGVANDTPAPVENRRLP